MYSHEPAGYRCPFCAIACGEETEHNKRSDVIYEDGDVLAFVSPKWWPRNPGNVLVIPRGHVESIYAIPDETLAKVNRIGKRVALAMKEQYGCEGISFRQHNEPAGGQDVWHFHLHVFPRWEKDDLYLNHDKSRYVTPEEREPYVAKLKGKILP